MPAKKLERVTEKDLEEVLSTQEIVGDPDDPDFKALVSAAGRELTRRFNTDPGSLPGTFVIKLFLDGMKALAAGVVPAVVDPGHVDVLASLQALPPEHALQLVEGEALRLSGLLDEYAEAAQRLKGETA